MAKTEPKMVVKHTPGDTEGKVEVLEAFNISIWYRNGTTEDLETRPVTESELLSFTQQLVSPSEEFIIYDLGDRWFLFGAKEAQEFPSKYIHFPDIVTFNILPVEEHGRRRPVEGDRAVDKEG